MNSPLFSLRGGRSIVRSPSRAQHGRRAAALAVAVVLGAQLSAAQAEDVHFTYLWHLEQPIYWPDRQVGGADRYERAWQSIQRTDVGAPNPANNLRDIFGNADRVAAYQYRTRDCVNDIRWTPEGGAQVSYSGGLIENVSSLGVAGQLGYGAAWYGPYREARGWTTAGGKPRMDVVLFPFHHALLPLCDENTVRKQVQLYKAIYADAWGASPPRSRGLFPSEMAFSERLIPVLQAEGVDWVVVSNEHISRACENYPLVLGSGGVNCEPPNRASRRNPPQAEWLRTSISRGCAPVNAYPFAYTPHYARYVDANTGAESRTIIVPADQAMSWQDGYAPLSLGGLATLRTQNPPSRPQLVLLAHDGDNAWGGGYSYYREATPNFVSTATSSGYVATTIEQYLLSHPVPAGDVVHVEDGAWVNADGDFGSPTFLNWLWPLLSSSGAVDVENGWHVDARNWAVITAAQNRVDTAEQIAGGVNLARIVYPDAATTNAERAWHYFGGALNSGFMYYGTPLDHEVKPTIACNRAVSYADAVIGGGSGDLTGPTIFIPQRWPYNPGSLNFGPAHGYQQQTLSGDFWVWTFAYDVSGLTGVTLKYRLDDDGAVGDANRTYAGGAGVGAWQSLPMTFRDFPAGNVYNDPSINFFEMPAYIADQYTAYVTGVRDELVDYYVEAVDGRGNLKRSPIQHVYVGDGSGSPGGGGPRMAVAPEPPVAGQAATLSYNPAGGPLYASSAFFAHIGFNNWQNVITPDLPMTLNAATGRWEVAINVALTATQIDVAINNGQGQWDNNNGADWHFAVTGTVADWVMDGQLDAGTTLVAQNGALQLRAAVRESRLYVAAPDAGEGNDHFVFLAGAGGPGALRAAPWAKSGQTAGWAAFLADENNNDFEGWFDASAAAGAVAATGPNGGWLEGTIDLAAEFGSLPTHVWLALAPYQTNDGGALAPGGQIPASTNGNSTLDAAEFARFDIIVFVPGDTNCDGAIDFFDIDPFLLALFNPATYVQAYPTCDLRSADLSGDDEVDFFDIDPFLACLFGGCP